MPQVLDEKSIQAARDLDELFAFFHQPLRTVGHDLISLATHGRILDIGCGGGDLVARLQKYNSEVGGTAEIYGVELDPRVAKLAQARSKGRIIRADAADMRFPDGFFDMIISICSFTNVLSGSEYRSFSPRPWAEYKAYVYEKEKRILGEIYRVAKKGALYLMFSEPTFMYEHTSLEAFTLFNFRVLYPRNLRRVYRNGFAEPNYILQKV